MSTNTALPLIVLADGRQLRLIEQPQELDGGLLRIVTEDGEVLARAEDVVGVDYGGEA